MRISTRLNPDFFSVVVDRNFTSANTGGSIGIQIGEEMKQAETGRTTHDIYLFQKPYGDIPKIVSHLNFSTAVPYDWTFGLNIGLDYAKAPVLSLLTSKSCILATFKLEEGSRLVKLEQEFNLYHGPLENHLHYKL